MAKTPRTTGNRIVLGIVLTVFGLNMLVFFGTFLISIFGSSSNQSSPHDLHALDITVHLNSNGTADISERWDMSINSDEGTEVYKPFRLESNQELFNYRVSMNDELFDYASFWDINDSREGKAYTYGLYEGSDGSEMTWGMSESGDNVYTVDYTISNFITQTDDDQMVYWGFINDSLDPAPESASVTITSDVPLNNELNKVWGFGYEGFTEITDNQVRWWTDKPMDSHNYLVGMLKFTGSPYSTAYVRPGSFETWLEDAFIDSDYSIQDYRNETYGDGSSHPAQAPKGPSLMDRIFPILIPLFFFGTFGFTGYTIFKQYRSIMKHYPPYGKLIKETEGEYFRGRLDEDVFAYAMALESLAIPDVSSYLIHAALLYLVRDGAIIMRDEGKHVHIKFTGKRSSNAQAEAFLRILESQTSRTRRKGEDMNLTRMLMSMEWREIELWLAQVRLHGIHYLKENDYATSLDKTVGKERYRADKQMELHFTDRGLLLRKNLVKYRNYLADYSLVAERSHNEVRLWDQMLIYAAVFGIADEFSEQVGMVEQPSDDQYTSSGYRRMRRFDNHSRLQRNISRSYSSNVSSSSSGGSGGRSSSGGGGSSGGSSSGGGTR